MTPQGLPAELNPLDVSSLRAQWRAAKPFPFLEIKQLLREDFARELAQSYPDYEQCKALGLEFSAVNEQRKVQICDAKRFPGPAQRLAEVLSSQPFLDLLTEATGIEKLMADEQLAGGGMHVTGPGGRLDVHVDFNILPDRPWYRRLNLLFYLNPDWQAEWGGSIELWDRDVRHCEHSFLPMFNRCIVFETSELSYHGVTPVRCPPNVTRKSFASYYYTLEPSPKWDGSSHSTIFRARPDEWLRGAVLMPVERARYHMVQKARALVRSIRHGGH